MMNWPKLSVVALSAVATALTLLFAPAPIASEEEIQTPLQTPIGKSISVENAYQLSLSNKLHLIDIRRPDEWKETGVATTAHTITMHQNIYAFLRELRKISPSLNERPIALICARGFRSRYMQRILRNHGLKHVIDVSEGMLGSADGPGWLKSNLPTKPWVAE